MSGRALLATFLFSFAAVAQAPSTIEQAIGSAFPSNLAAAPTGSRFAWVQNARGVRNIWIAEPPGYQGRPLTSYTADDGQEILPPAPGKILAANEHE